MAPEQISAFLKKKYDDSSMHLSPESIYTYLYVLPRGALRKELLSHLRQFRTKRRQRGKGNAAHGPIPDSISIHERPEEIEDRCIPGHWEGDLIIGEGYHSALGTLVERTTRTTLLIPLKDKDAESVRKAFARQIKYLPKQMKLSMTYDRGGEMAQHKLFTKETKMKVYFADPQSPGNAAPMKIPMVLYVNIFLKALTSVRSVLDKFVRCGTYSTVGPGKYWIGHRPSRL